MTGSGKTLNFPIVKTIKLNEKQANLWQPKRIRNFLDAKLDKTEIFYENIIKKFIPKFLAADLDIDFNDKEFEVIERLYNEIQSKEKENVVI